MGLLLGGVRDRRRGKEVFMTVEERINEANGKVMDMFLNGRPVWTDVRPALEVVPGMKKNLILHPGPPIDKEHIVFPLKNSISGAAVHEGLAKNVDEAWNMVLSGEIEIAPAQEYSCGCAAAMVMSASMPVIVVEDKYSGGKGYSTPHPGPKPKVLRWGLYDEEVEEDLKAFEKDYCPYLGEAVRKSGGIDIISIFSKTAGMGDENHNRQPAGSMCLALTLAPYLLDIDAPKKAIKDFLANDRFFLNPVMASALSIIASAKKVKCSTVMTAMCGNGEEFGIQVAGTGNKWYTTEAPYIEGTLLKPTYKKSDMLRYMGDSCVTEVYGFGGMTAIAGPMYMKLTGSSFEEALSRTEKARKVSLGEHTFAPVPWNDYKGMPVGVDVRKVVGYNVLPISHGGSGLKTGGQAGAGAAELPMECFKKALVGVAEDMGII